MRTNAKIYVMRAEDGTLKLGHSTRPERRRRQLDQHVQVVHETDVLEHAERIERLAHRVLALHGKHLRGEWFEANLDEAIRAIEIATRQAEGEELQLVGRITKQQWKQARDLETINMRLPPALKAELQRLADADRRSLTNYIEGVLLAHVDRRKYATLGSVTIPAGSLAADESAEVDWDIEQTAEGPKATGRLRKSKD